MALLPGHRVRLGVLLARHGHSLDDVGLRGQFEAVVLDVDKQHNGRDEFVGGAGPAGEAREAGVGDDAVDALKQRLDKNYY